MDPMRAAMSTQAALMAPTIVARMEYDIRLISGMEARKAVATEVAGMWPTSAAVPDPPIRGS